MPYFLRSIGLADAIELGKQRRPFLKQPRANVLNQKEQVHAAAGQLLPTLTTTEGGEWVSSSRRCRRGAVACPQRPSPVAHGANDAFASVFRIQFIPRGVRPGHWRAEYLHRIVRQPGAARDAIENLRYQQWRGR